MTEATTPSGYENDQRLPTPSTYNKQECIDVVNDFLSYLTGRLPYLQSEWIVRPPKNGWPNITPETFKPLHKTREVIDLLAHLPYIHVPGQSNQFTPQRNWPAILRDTYLYNFSGESFEAALRAATTQDQEQASETLSRYQQPLIEVPPWVICLATGTKNGHYLLLDTSDGIITLPSQEVS